MEASNVLVVYYTSSGNTGKVAYALAAALGADLEAIEPVTTYPFHAPKIVADTVAAEVDAFLAQVRAA